MNIGTLTSSDRRHANIPVLLMLPLNGDAANDVIVLAAATTTAEAAAITFLNFIRKILLDIFERIANTKSSFIFYNKLQKKATVILNTNYRKI